LPLLSEVGDGRLDPRADEVRRRCGSCAAVLRRTLAHPPAAGMLAALEPAVHAAEERGVTVETQVAGALETVPGRAVTQVAHAVSLALGEPGAGRAVVTVISEGATGTAFVAYDTPPSLTPARTTETERASGPPGARTGGDRPPGGGRQPAAGRMAGAETGRAEITAAEITTTEIRATEITAAEITAAEITAAEITAAEITAGEVAAAEVASLDAASLDAAGAESAGAESSGAESPGTEIAGADCRGSRSAGARSAGPVGSVEGPVGEWIDVVRDAGEGRVCVEVRWCPPPGVAVEDRPDRAGDGDPVRQADS
jgi:hypothetical protein